MISRLNLVPFFSLGCLTLGACLLFGASALSEEHEQDNRLYEMRIYYAAEGKLEALENRFRNHTVKLFEKHGMTNIGYWKPLENPERVLLYVLAYPNQEAREASWKAFMNDPDWKAAHAESEKDGTLVAKINQKFMVATDYSPQPEAMKKEGDKVFELRTYTTTEGNLDRLNARFRNHTVKLFEKHGMTNVVYWTLAPDQEGSKNTLIYFLAHDSKEAAAKSFGAFRDDPDWNAARTASEKEAGGSLTAPDGVKSQFLSATDYSPLK